MLTRSRLSLIPVRIGALLVSSGLLRADHMASALLAARQNGKKIGEVLLAQKLITEAELRCALELQRLIKDGSITIEMGTEAMRLAHRKKLAYEAVLAELGWSPQKNISSHDLASVLLESGCVTKPQLDQATWNSAKNAMPLGRNLVLTGAISPSTLGCALTVLVLLRDKRIDVHSGIAGLRRAVESKTSVEEALGIPATAEHNHVRIGELLSLAGLLSESDAMMAVENSLLNQRSIGQVLLEARMVSPLVLDACLKLQAMIERGECQRTQAAELLRLVASEQLELEHFLHEMSSLKSSVLGLLLSSGLVTDDMIQVALRKSPESQDDMVRALFSAEFVTSEMFRAAVRCTYAIDGGSYTKQDAIAWLRYSFASQAVAEATA